MSTASVAAQVEQNQRGFQKQDCIFVGKKRVLGKGKKESTKGTRYYKAVGLGIKTPRTAIEGTYVDKKCPWTGARTHRGVQVGRCGGGGSSSSSSCINSSSSSSCGTAASQRQQPPVACARRSRG